MFGAARFDTGDLVLDRYRLTDVIGEGGVGVVWRATDQQTGLEVAVKVLGAHATRNRTARQRMEREARTLGGLSHPHLVKLLDYAIVDDTIPILVMEYFPGESLQARVDRVGSFGVLQTAIILQQVLSALVVCHRAQVIHRDLKPGNLLVRLARDGQPEVRIIDFGIVQLLADDGATALTLNGEVFGSPRYMSPEQWQQRAVDPRTDVYAIGLIGYALLTGKHFIQADNPIQAFEAHLGAPRPLVKLTARGEPVPVALAQAIAKACHPDPNSRHSSVEALKQVMDLLITPSGSWSSVAATMAVDAVSGVDDDDDDDSTSAIPEVYDDSLLDDPPSMDGHPPDLDATLMDVSQIPGFAALANLPPPPPPGAAPGRGAGEARLGMPGEENTAITRGDFERAVRESAGLPGTGATPAVGPTSARGGLQVARVDETAAVDAVPAGMTDAAARPAPSRPTLPGPPRPVATPQPIPARRAAVAGAAESAPDESTDRTRVPDLAPKRSIWARLFGWMVFWRRKPR